MNISLTFYSSYVDTDPELIWHSHYLMDIEQICSFVLHFPWQRLWQNCLPGSSLSCFLLSIHCSIMQYSPTKAMVWNIILLSKDIFVKGQNSVLLLLTIIWIDWYNETYYGEWEWSVVIQVKYLIYFSIISVLLLYNFIINCKNIQ